MAGSVMSSNLQPIVFNIASQLVWSADVVCRVELVVALLHDDQLGVAGVPRSRVNNLHGRLHGELAEVLEHISEYQHVAYTQREEW